MSEIRKHWRVSDCGSTVAVIDFYKHPFRRVSELHQPPPDDMQHRHSSGQTDEEREQEKREGRGKK